MEPNGFLGPAAAGSGASSRERTTAILKGAPFNALFLVDGEKRMKIFRHFKEKENCDDFVNFFTDEDRIEYLDCMLDN